GPDKLQPGKALADLVEDEGRAIAILDARRMDDHAQRQGFDIDEGMQLSGLHLLAGVVTRCVLSPRLAAPLFPPLSATGCRGSRRSGWPRGRALRAAPCGALPKCAPTRRRAGTGGRCCRPWNAEEMRRAADTARDSPCAEDRRSHSSPRECRSCAPARPASPPGSTVQGAPTAHRSNRSADLAKTVCKSPCAPASTSRIKASEPSRRR